MKMTSNHLNKAESESNNINRRNQSIINEKANNNIISISICVANENNQSMSANNENKPM